MLFAALSCDDRARSSQENSGVKPSPFKYHDPSEPFRSHRAPGIAGERQAARRRPVPRPDAELPLRDARSSRRSEQDSWISGIEIKGRSVRIGAMARQRVLERDPGLQKTVPSCARRCSRSATSRPATAAPSEEAWRTLDPAAELPGVMALYDATLELAGPRGKRTVPMAEWGRGTWRPTSSPTRS
jgi:carbon-monoxide dehydrogenase medium subunit